MPSEPPVTRASVREYAGLALLTLAFGLAPMAYWISASWALLAVIGHGDS